MDDITIGVGRRAFEHEIRMGQTYQAALKQLKRATNTDDFKNYVQKQAKKQLDSLRFRCPGCNEKVNYNHSVKACVRAVYQESIKEIRALRNDAHRQALLLQKADQIKSKYPKIIQ